MTTQLEPATFEFARQARIAGTARDLIRGATNGSLVRVRSGVYLPKHAWIALKSDARYRAEVRAAAAVVDPSRQFSHDSAAALWRLPSLGPWRGIHVLGEAASGGRSSRNYIRHGVGLDAEPLLIDGVLVTSLARTAVDIAMTSTFIRAVCMIDSALSTPGSDDFRFGMVATNHAALLESIEARSGHRGCAKGTRAVEFGVGQSGSIGESISRVNFHLLGLPAPLLQVPFYDEAGLIGYVDFYWPQLGLIGEFDGQIKYRGETYLRGRLPEDVVWAEKLREDRLRRVSRGLVRWTWQTALDREALGRRVAPFGLVPRR